MNMLLHVWISYKSCVVPHILECCASRKVFSFCYICITRTQQHNSIFYACIHSNVYHVCQFAADGRPTRDWPEYRKSASQMTIFDYGFQNGWYDSSWSTWVQPLKDSANSGFMGSAAVCGKVSKGVRSLTP